MVEIYLAYLRPLVNHPYHKTTNCKIEMSMKITTSSSYRVPELNYMKYIARRQNNFQVVIRTYFGLELSHLCFLVVGSRLFGPGCSAPK